MAKCIKQPEMMWETVQIHSLYLQQVKILMNVVDYPVMK